MSSDPDQMQHFLVIYDIPNAHVQVEEFGTDSDAAVAAYGEREKELSGRPDLEVVLLGADSIETVKKTHSSYFEEPGEGFERFFRGLLTEV